jgi:hypothetical protein
MATMAVRRNFTILYLISFDINVDSIVFQLHLHNLLSKFPTKSFAQETLNTAKNIKTRKVERLVCMTFTHRYENAGKYFAFMLKIYFMKITTSLFLNDINCALPMSRS